MTRRTVETIPAGMRLSEHSIAVPTKAQDAVAALIRSWEFKRRAGFAGPAVHPFVGQKGALAKRLLGMTFTEPIRVVWADEHGFGYETRPGHPIYGEESFVLEDGVFTARSVSRPSTLFWRMLAPILLRIQRATHARYAHIVAAEIDAAV